MTDKDMLDRNFEHLFHLRQVGQRSPRPVITPGRLQTTAQIDAT
ncbi:MAG: hypothetical protein AAF622_00870 [Cyanobacteria bacterium P01_C01_bin.147]